MSAATIHLASLSAVPLRVFVVASDATAGIATHPAFAAMCEVVRVDDASALTRVLEHERGSVEPGDLVQVQLFHGLV